jgi:signal transduction histidine kinase
MRERAEELGGLLTAVPSPAGGRVLARLPLARSVSRLGGP